MKTRIYAAPAVKGLRDCSEVLKNEILDPPDLLVDFFPNAFHWILSKNWVRKYMGSIKIGRWVKIK